MGRRRSFQRDGVTLSYVDFGGEAANTLVCLHGRSGCARNFAPLAQALTRALGKDWRVVGLDQRGHGWSDHGDDRSRAAFIADAAALIERLACGPVALLGHSLGGVNAYQLAGRRPDLVRALVVEDIGCRFGPPESGESWPLRWDTLDQLLAHMAASPLGLDRLLLDSLVEYEDGWGFRFSDAWYGPARDALTGDWSADWAAVACPILLLHGSASWAVTRAEIERMAALNPRTQVHVFDGAGHTPHDERAADFAAALRAFLAGLDRA